MRVLLVSASYAPVVGGLQTTVAQLAAALTRANQRVAVITQRHPRALPAAERVAGVPVRRLLAVWPEAAMLRGRRPDLWLYGMATRGSQLRRLRCLAARFRPDVIHAHFAAGICAWLPDVLSHGAGVVPLVLTVHGDDIARLPATSPAERARRERLLSAADILTAPSQHLLREAAFLAAHATKRVVVPNGVAAPLFAQATPRPWPRPYVAAAGRLVPKKGFDLLLDAFAALDTPCDLLIAGDGPERAALQSQAERLGLGDRAHLLGALSEAGVASLLRGARLVAIPSRREPFGLVGLEAWAAGAPVVATSAGGLPEALAGSGAVFAAPHSAQSLRDALGLALRQPQAPPPVPPQRCWDAIAQQYEALYAQAIRETAAGARLPATN